MSETQASAVRMVEVDEGSDGQRIDNFLLKNLKGVPKTRIYRLLRKGEVRVNKKRIKPDFRLSIGDVVRIPPVRVSEKPEASRPGDRVLQVIKESILYEDDGLLVLNKPSGLAVHGGSGLSYGVIEGLRALRPEARFLELAHRLDRDTSGCLVICKKRSVLRAFQEQLREGGMEKFYLTLLKGRWKGGGKRIDAPLRKNELKSGERMVKVSKDGKPSLSIFTPLTIYKECSLMRVKLITGRTHQVRVHAQHSGHPIAGDEKYGDDAFNREMSQKGLKRLFLHAAELHFTLPEHGTVHVEAPLEPKLLQLLDRLETE